MGQPHEVIRVVGIDLAAGRGTTEVVSLALANPGDMPIFDPARHRPVVSDADIVTAVVSHRPAVVAIDAPLSLPAPVMRSLATLAPRGSEHAGVRSSPSGNHTTSMSEPPASPYLRAAERDPIWSRLGVRPFPVSFLGGLTFRAIALLPELRAALPDVAIVEVFPSGTARALRLHAYDAAATARPKRPAKTTPGARASLQRGLSARIAGVPAPDTELLGADLLDALLAALTGVFFLRGAYVALGDTAEGQIVLPHG